MRQRVDFLHDSKNDVIIATPHWDIQSEADLEQWYRQYELFMKRFSRKMDFVVVLDDFNVAPSLGPRWGEYRARIHKQFIRFNYRVHSNNKVRVFINTSGVRYDVGREEADSVQDAIEGIMASRKAAGVDEAGTMTTPPAHFPARTGHTP